MVATGYDGGPPVPRNAPTTFNVASWRRRLMLDGRIERVGRPPGGGISTPDSAPGVPDPGARPTLAATQARFPQGDEVEMKGFAHAGKEGDAMRAYLASRLGGYGDGSGELVDPDYWVEKFREVFGPGTPEEVVTADTIADALGAYVDSQNLFQSPWFRYVRGETGALSDSAKRGALVFFRPTGAGGAQCSSCHAGDLFSDEAHHALAIPQVGRGKGDGVAGLDDFGRFRVTGNFGDLYEFRTPTLLNVAVTGPFGHSGAYETLEGVVRHHLSPAVAIAAYDPASLTQEGIQSTDSWRQRADDALAKLSADRAAGRPAIQDVALSDAQVVDVLAFLEALTDPCTRDPGCFGRWVLDPGADPDPNGDQLVPKFR
jgi:cytochrome c peroxidase